MAYTAVISSGLILLLLPNQTTASRFLLFVRHDDMNYTDAKEACESFGGRLAVPGSFNEEEKLDVMQCIPPNVVFWTNQRGAKDACLVTFLLGIKCFYEKRFYQHDFLCEAERDSIRYSYYLRRGDVCSNQDIHPSILSPSGNATAITTTPSSTTRTPGPEQTLSPVRTLQTIGTRPPDGDKTTPLTDVTSTQRDVNGTEISEEGNRDKSSGGVSNIGASAAIAIFSAILILTMLGIFYIYVKRKKPELLRRASFWKTPEPVQNEYDTVRPRQGQEHSYGYMRSSDPPGDYLQPNPSAIRSRNIDNIDYLVEADDNIISGVDRTATSCQAPQENDYDYIHIDDAECGKPPPQYDLARAIPNCDYEKCSQSQNTSITLTSHDYYNTSDSKIVPPKDLECRTNEVVV